MRRADRLFQLIQILRRCRITTAERLAKELEVSERTIYRDIRDLICSGVPIEGEAGVGYRLPKGFDLPPLMFTEEEIEALVWGARVTKGFADHALAQAAGSALNRIESVLPERLRDRVSKTNLFALNFAFSDEHSKTLALIRKALPEKNKLLFSYTREDGLHSERVVRPLCLSFIAPQWLLTAWCELRKDFRNFRLDRLTDLVILKDQFSDEPGKNLEDFLVKVRSEKYLGEGAERIADPES